MSALKKARAEIKCNGSAMEERKSIRTLAGVRCENDGQLDCPAGLAIGVEGESDCINGGPHTAMKFIFMEKWGQRGRHSGQFEYPSGIAIGRNGTVYVTDTGNDRIQCFSSTGAFIRSWGGYGDQNGRFKGPCGIAISAYEPILFQLKGIPELEPFPPGVLPMCVMYLSDEYVYVVEERKDRIQIFECDGTYISGWGETGTEDGKFHRPKSCAMGSDGKVYVADTFNHRIQVFHSDGSFIRKWGGFGHDDGKLCFPTLSLSKSGLIYAVNSSDNSLMCNVQWFQPDGTFVGRFECEQELFSVFVDDKDQIIYAMHMVDSITARGMDGTFLSHWGTLGPGGGRLGEPRWMAKTADGRMYVTDSINHRVIMFKVTKSENLS